jgi:CheY-like chemotaxis protein
MSTDNKGLHGDGPALTPEKRAADIMLSVLGLNRSELADVYRSQTQDDPTQKLYELATIAASEYKARGESIPAHVQALLASARQQQLLLEGLSLECSIPKILLVDAEVDRIIGRRTIFETHQYHVDMAFTLPEALAKLATETFHAVIVEWPPVNPQDLEALHELQIWNLQVPIINVSAWDRLIRQDERQFNWNLVRALAKAFGRRMPRKLPERKPVVLDSGNANGEEDDLFGTSRA